jgi:hypothetical protein
MAARKSCRLATLCSAVLRAETCAQVDVDAHQVARARHRCRPSASASHERRAVEPRAEHRLEPSAHLEFAPRIKRRLPLQRHFGVQAKHRAPLAVHHAAARRVHRLLQICRRCRTCCHR